MGKYHHTTLFISENDKKKLEEIARKSGYIQTRGAGAGKLGSISALMRAIASKEVRLLDAEEASKTPSPS